MFELQDKKAGDDLVDNTESHTEIQLEEKEVNEFVQLIDNKMDDFSNKDNQVADPDKPGGFRIKELDAKKKENAQGGKQTGQSRAHTLRQLSLARAGLDLFDSDSISMWQVMTNYTGCMDMCYLILGTLAAIIFGACFPAFFYVFGLSIDQMGQTTSAFNYDPQEMYDVNIMMAGLAAIAFLSAWMQITLIAWYSEGMSRSIAVNYFALCMEKDGHFFDKAKTDQIARKLMHELKLVRSMGEHWAYAFQSGVAFLGSFGVAFWQGWLFTCVLLPGVPVIVCTGLILTIALNARARQAAKSYVQAGGLAEQAIDAIKLVHAYSNEYMEKQNYTQRLKENHGLIKKQIKSAALSLGFIYFLIYLFYAFALYVGGQFRTRDVSEYNGGFAYSGGQVLCIMGCILLGSFDLGTVVTHIKALNNAKKSGQMMIAVMKQMNHLKGEETNDEGFVKSAEFKGSVEFQNVTFAYPTNEKKNILNDFSHTFVSNKTTAIFGFKCGKSTMIHLIERNYDPKFGNIMIDGKYVEELDICHLRQKIGYVGEDPFIFNTTIRENMLFANPKATDEEIIKQLKDLEAWNFLKKGLDTKVGDPENSFSNGELQQLAVARAFISMPTILLLDEATSAMNKKGIDAVYKHIQEYREAGNCLTVIVVPFRIREYQKCDQIVCVKHDGSKHCDGTHDSLLADSECDYAVYINAQQTSEETQLKVEAQMTDIQAQMQKQLLSFGKKKKPHHGKQKANDVADQEELEYIQDSKARDEAEDRMLMEHKKQCEKVSYFRKIWRENDSKCLMFLGLLTALASGVIQPLFGYTFGDQVYILSQNYNIYGVEYKLDEVPAFILRNTFFVLAIAVGLGVTIGLRIFSFGTLSLRLTFKMRQKVYASILSKHIGFFDEDKYTTDYLTDILKDDIPLLNGVSVEVIGPYIEALFGVITALVLSLLEEREFFVWCLPAYPVIMISSYMMWQYQKGLIYHDLDDLESAYDFAYEMITNYQTAQSFGFPEIMVQKYSKMLLEYKTKNRCKNLWVGFGFGLAEGCFIASFAYLFWAGTAFLMDYFNEDENKFEVEADQINVSIFVTVFGSLCAGTAHFFGPNYSVSRKAAERVFDVLEYPTKIDAVQMNENPDLKSANNLTGKIEFKNVWFRYPYEPEKFVLRGCSFVIEPNQDVCVIGALGSGKTAIFELLMRFYNPDYGEILLDGVSITAYKLHPLRKQVSVVMKQPKLFNYSVLENILYGDKNASNQQVMDAVELANATDFVNEGKFHKYDFTAKSLMATMEANKEAIVNKIGQEKYDEEIMVLEEMAENELLEGIFQAEKGLWDRRSDDLKQPQLPIGYGKTIGTQGCKLSIDQKKRLQVARAIVFKPKILLVDDITLGMEDEPEQEASVKKALENAMKEVTAIYFTERANYAARMGCHMIVLENGRVAQQGQFDELKSQNGVLSKLIINA